MFPYSELLLNATVDFKREQISRDWGRPTRFRRPRRRRSEQRRREHVLAA